MGVSRLGTRFIDGTRGRLVALLRRGARTVEELAQSVELTDNAVRSQLTSLERDGLVRDFGAMLARDHAQVRQLGRDLAAKLGVTPTPPADDASGRAHDAAMKHLRTLGGSEFDHAFLRHEVAFHKGVIDAVQTTLLPAIRNAEVKELVVKVAPAFQAHMLAAQQLDETLVSEVAGSPMLECCDHGERPRCCFRVGSAA